MRKGPHLKRWGWVYLLALMFVGSWVMQLLTMQSTIEQQGYAEFWAATFENWQSEFLQLMIQAILISAAAHVGFQAGAEDTDEIKRQLREIKQLVQPGGAGRYPRPGRPPVGRDWETRNL